MSVKKTLSVILSVMIMLTAICGCFSVTASAEGTVTYSYVITTDEAVNAFSGVIYYPKTLSVNTITFEGVKNQKNGKILFNDSNISVPYDFSGGKAIISVEFNVNGDYDPEAVYGELSEFYSIATVADGNIPFDYANVIGDEVVSRGHTDIDNPNNSYSQTKYSITYRYKDNPAAHTLSTIERTIWSELNDPNRLAQICMPEINNNCYTYSIGSADFTDTGRKNISVLMSESLKEYTVTWKNEDGTQIDTTSVPYGSLPTHADAVKAGHYSFLKWSPAVTPVTGDTEYTAQFVNHTIVHTAAAPATFESDGNIEYWYCADCRKYYTDENCENEIAQAGTVIPRKIAVAQIGSAKYETLAEAVASADDGDEITVIADTTLPCYFTQISGKSITIDASGYTVTGEGYTNFPMFNVKSTGGLTLTGGTFQNPGGIISNSGKSVIDGAALNAGGFAVQNKGTLEIKSGTITASESAVTNGAATAMTTITGGSFTGKLKMSNDGDGSVTVYGGTFDRAVPAEFCAVGLVPSEQDSLSCNYTVVLDTSSPLNPLSLTASQINDNNAFGLSADYLKGTLLGVQSKSIAGKDTSSQETGQDIRFIACLDTDIIQSPDTEDYGFVMAKLNNSKTYENTNFENLKADGGNGEKIISCKGTVNTVCGNNAYGNPSDSSTDYKYITCGVNNIDSDGKVVARFYVKINGKYYYAKYSGHDYKYTGCLVSWADVVQGGNV